MENTFEYVGHLHIHTSFSDGSGSVEEVAEAARKAGLDFIGITDHNTLGGKHRGLEGVHHGVLVLFGVELNNEKNHYLSFNVEEEIPPNTANPQEVIDAVNAQGGFGYLAHPVEKSNPFVMEGKSFEWTAWDVEGFTGLEIWNFGSQWRLAFKNRLTALFWYYVNTYYPSRFPDEEGLQKWDELNKKRLVLGFGGSDAHNFPAKLGPVKIVLFPYEFLFRTINTHVVLQEELESDFASAKRQLFTALKSGHFFTASDYLKPARGFRFYAFNENSSEQPVHMSGEIPHSTSTALHLTSPSSRCLIRLIKDGEVVNETKKQYLGFKVLAPGSFRAEVYWRSPRGKLYPWIYSNPIRVIPQKKI